MTPNYPACYVLFRKGNSVLFTLRENTGFMDGMYGLPAGRVEEFESFATGAAREALEEVGLKVDPKNLRHVHTQHRISKQKDKNSWVDVFFEASEWSGDPINAEPDKHARVEWLNLNALPPNIMNYQRHALEAIAAGSTYGEFSY